MTEEVAARLSLILDRTEKKNAVEEWLKEQNTQTQMDQYMVPRPQTPHTGRDNSDDNINNI